MGVDLSSRTWVERFSLVLTPDALVRLQHGRGSDRVFRYAYEGIESIVLWRTTPWARIIIYSLLFGIPGVLFIGFYPDLAAPQLYVGICFLLLTAGLLAWLFYCGVTNIQIGWGGRHWNCAGVMRPGRVRSFESRLVSFTTAAHPPSSDEPSSEPQPSDPTEAATPPPFTLS